jgi:hypothetical protein
MLNEVVLGVVAAFALVDDGGAATTFTPVRTKEVQAYQKENWWYLHLATSLNKCQGRIVPLFLIL